MVEYHPQYYTLLQYGQTDTIDAESLALNIEWVANRIPAVKTKLLFEGKELPTAPACQLPPPPTPVPGDTCSSAFANNSLSQIVGISSPDCGFFISAFLWEDGDLVDLNDLVSPKSDVILLEPNVITDQGVIGVNGIPPGCDNSDTCGHPYLLVPIGDCDKDNEARIAARQSHEAAAIFGAPGWHPMIGGKTPVSPIERMRNLLPRSLRLSGRRIKPD